MVPDRGAPDQLHVYAAKCRAAAGNDAHRDVAQSDWQLHAGSQQTVCQLATEPARESQVLPVSAHRGRAANRSRPGASFEVHRRNPPFSSQKRSLPRRGSVFLGAWPIKKDRISSYTIHSERLRTSQTMAELPAPRHLVTVSFFLPSTTSGSMFAPKLCGSV